MNQPESGFITHAFGWQHAEMALDLALSIRKYHSEPISIVVDQKAARLYKPYKNLPFDSIKVVHDKVHPWGAKFLVAEHSPYKKTVYVDADVLFLRRYNLIDFDLTHPIAMYGAYMPPNSRAKTYHPIHQICSDFGLSRYFWATSGAFVFSPKEAQPMFSECYEFYTKGRKQFPKYASVGFPDEMAFGVLSDRYPIQQILPVGHPWPSAIELAAISQSDTKWPLIHFFAPIEPRFYAALMTEVAERRKALGLRATSADIWRNKSEGIPSFKEKVCHLARRLGRRVIGQ